MRNVLFTILLILLLVGLIFLAFFSFFHYRKQNKELTHDRDSLIFENSALKNDTAYLRKQYFDTKNDFTSLRKKYEELINPLLSKNEQLNKALKNREDDISRKEKRLNELENALAAKDSLLKSLYQKLLIALKDYDVDELKIEVKKGKVYISLMDKLLFKSGSADVEKRGKTALKLVADVLNKNSDVEIFIEGHTDNVPIKTSVFKDNWDLSTYRATSVVRILTANYKIAPKRLIASGKGEYFPVANNSTEEGRAKNRRTEIILVPKLDQFYELLENAIE